jgi:MFS family permease
MLRPMEADLGYSRVQLTGALSIGLLTSALAALPVGRWIDRHGARGVMALGSCLATALLLMWSRIESLGALYAVWALMGSRWRRRSTSPPSRRSSAGSP